MSNNYHHAVRSNEVSVYKDFIQQYKDKKGIEAKVMIENAWLAIDELEFKQTKRENHYEAYANYLNNDSPQVLKPNKKNAELLADKALLKEIKQSKWSISQKSEHYVNNCYACKPRKEFSYIQSFSSEALAKLSPKDEVKSIYGLLCIDVLDQHVKNSTKMDEILSSSDFKYCSKIEHNDALFNLLHLIKNAKNNIPKNKAQRFVDLYKNPMLNGRLAKIEYTRLRSVCEDLILKDGSVKSEEIMKLKEHLNVIKILLGGKFNGIMAKQVNTDINNLFNQFYKQQERSKEVQNLPKFIISMDMVSNLLKDIGAENVNLSKGIYPQAYRLVQSILISSPSPKFNLPSRLSEKKFLQLSQDNKERLPAYLGVLCEDRTFYRAQCIKRSSVFKYYDELDQYCTQTSMQMSHDLCQTMSKDLESCVQSTLGQYTRKKDLLFKATMSLFEKLAKKGELSKKYLDLIDGSCLETEELEQISQMQSTGCSSFREVECTEDQKYSNLCTRTLKKRTLQCDLSQLKYIRKFECKYLLRQDLIAMCNEHYFFEDKNQLKCDKIAERRMRQCKPIIKREEKKYCSNDLCKSGGYCTFDGTKCIVASDRDCRKSKICREDGKCTAGNKKCIATSVRDCRKSTDCRNYGNCDLNYSLKSCHPGNHLHCRRSIDHCRKNNFCTLYDTEFTSRWDGERKKTNYCGPRTDLDCKRSDVCKTRGLCERSMIDNAFWKGWSCLPTDEGCAKSKICRTEGKCVTEYNKRYCWVDDESCEKSLTCKKDGNCVAGDTGECTSAEEEDED